MLRGRTHKVAGHRHRPPEVARREVRRRSSISTAPSSAIRLAVDAAERMAGLTVESLIVNLSAGRLKSDTYSATINLGGHEVDAADVKRVLAAGAKQALKAEREVVHSLPIGFSLDGERGVRDPRGMVGDTLGVDMHVLTGDAAPLRNLELCINRAHLSVERMVATPYASGLAALVDDEARNGRGLHRHGRRHDDDLGLRRRQVRPCRRHSGRRQPRHHGLARGPLDPARAMPSG